MPVHLGVHMLGLAVAAGLAALALTERRAGPGRQAVAVGGLLLLAAHLVTGALLAEPTGWPMLLRTAGYASLALGAAGHLGGVRVPGPAGVVPVVAVLPGVVHLTAALAGAAAALAAARGVLGRGRRVALLVAGVLLWAGGDLVVAARPGVAAGLSAAGSLAVGGWVLARAAGTSLAGRFVGAAWVVLVLLTVSLGTASGVRYSTDLRAEQADRLATVAGAHTDELGDAWPRELETTASLLTSAALVDEVRAAEQADDLDGRASAIAGLPGVDLALIVDTEGAPRGAVRAGGELAAADVATLAGDRTVEVALAGDPARGLVALGDGQLLAVGAAPVAPIGDDGAPRRDQLAGALLVGRLVTADAVVERVAADTGSDAALMVGGSVRASTLSAATDREVAAVDGTGPATIGGDERTVARAAVGGDEAGDGGALVLALPSAAASEVAASATRSTFLVAAAGLLLAGAAAVAVSRRLTHPVRELTAAAERVAGGDLSAPVAVAGHDEVGRLAAAFDGMTTALAGREAQLREAATTQTALRARLEAVTAAMGEALLAVDGDGRVALANPAAEELLAGGGDPRGRPVTTLLPGTVEGGGSLVQAVGVPPETRTASARAALPDGRVVAATAAPLQDDEGRAGRVYVLRDVTAEAAADRLRTEIVANVSHELRTPLTPIVGYLELLQGRELPTDKVREFAGQGARAAQQLRTIVEKFIDLADLEAGNTPLVVEDVDVAAAVGDAVERWRPRLDERLHRRVRRGLPRVAADPRLLSRVLDELVDNAAKFSDGPVRMLADAGEDGEVRLTVRDRGPGIDADHVERVLADFEQADGSATRRFGGLGLGLSIARRMAERQDARLELGPAPGGGTDATLVLRRADA